MAKAICVREGSIRQLADATAGEGVSARTPSVRAAQKRRASWINLSWLVMRLLAIFVRMNIRGGRLIRFRSSTSHSRYVRSLQKSLLGPIRATGLKFAFR